MILPKVLAVLIIGFFGLVALVAFLVALVKAIKEKDTQKVKNLLLTAANEAVRYAESILGINGETKKSIALTKMNQIFIDKKMKYNEKDAAAAIEEAIDFSKEVNAHEINELKRTEKAEESSVKVESATKQKIARIRELLNS